MYRAPFAELYDLFHAAKPYRAEARFIRDAVRAELPGNRGTLRLLDLACGTGSHAIEFSRMQFDVTGIDSSPEMLTHARRKARRAKRKVRFECQDLTTLALGEEQWDVATCLFDSIGYLHTDRRITGALRRIGKALRPEGLLVLEVWHAPAMLHGFDPVRIRRVQSGGIEAVRIAETRLLAQRKVAEVRYDVFSRKRNQAWRRFNETHVTRFFTAAEISALLAAAGFGVKRITGGYTDSAPAQDAWHLVVVAERESPRPSYT
jgi:SAM-dependent methyltransferase